MSPLANQAAKRKSTAVIAASGATASNHHLRDREPAEGKKYKVSAADGTISSTTGVGNNKTMTRDLNQSLQEHALLRTSKEGDDKSGKHGADTYLALLYCSLYPYPKGTGFPLGRAYNPNHPRMSAREKAKKRTPSLLEDLEQMFWEGHSPETAYAKLNEMMDPKDPLRRKYSYKPDNIHGPLPQNASIKQWFALRSAKKKKAEEKLTSELGIE